VLAIGDGAQIGVAGYLSKNQNLGQIAAALDAIAAARLAFDPVVPSLASLGRLVARLVAGCAQACGRDSQAGRNRGQASPDCPGLPSCGASSRGRAPGRLCVPIYVPNGLAAL
jgi:hypothetical protein